MKAESRIPALNEVSFDGALKWFSILQTKGILFNPEDDPADIVTINGKKLIFSAAEASECKAILGTLEEALGHEAVVDAAYPVFMNACNFRLDA